jgi:hypothetical protein
MSRSDTDFIIIHEDYTTIQQWHGMIVLQEKPRPPSLMSTARLSPSFRVLSIYSRSEAQPSPPEYTHQGWTGTLCTVKWGSEVSQCPLGHWPQPSHGDQLTIIIIIIIIITLFYFMLTASLVLFSTMHHPVFLPTTGSRRSGISLEQQIFLIFFYLYIESRNI